MYFSISLRSNTWLDTGETHGCSGTSLETRKKADYMNINITTNKAYVLSQLVGGNAWPLTLAKLATSISVVRS